MSVTATEQARAVWCCSTCGAIYHKDFPRCPIDGAEVVMADRDPLLGATIGQYQIDLLIGEGGMGRVYLARHAHLPNKRYAIKVLLGDHSASAAMRTRFTREAERASQLDHPNVARVVDFGQTQHGLLYIVMDYVDGPSLVTLVGDTPMAPARVVALTREICKGLAYAHAAGIVHRDLKPENILVTTLTGDDGATTEVPWLVDFGLALSIDQTDARLTESGMTMGTPAFAAPEQLSGKPIDNRADLYALGMTMFEMLSGGMSPVDGSVMEVVASRTARDAPRLSERAPGLGVPAALDDIVAKLTRKRPHERYASAHEVIEALDALDAGALAPSAEPAVEVAGAPADAGAKAAEAGAPASAATRPASEPVPTVEPALTSAEASPRPSSTERMRRRPRRGQTLGVIVSCGVLAGVIYALVHTAGQGVPPRIDDLSSNAGASLEAADALVATAPAPAPALSSPPAPIAAAPSPPPAAASAPPPAAAVAGSAASLPSPSSPAAAAPVKPSETRTPGRPPARERVRPEPPPAAPLIIEPAAPVIAPAPPPQPARPLPHELTALAVDTSGSLPAVDVQRAVQRQRAAITRCAIAVPSAAPLTVMASFTIGETRRAQGVEVTGASADATACITQALGAVRTESAPDIGEVEVKLRLTFAVKA